MPFDPLTIIKDDADKVPPLPPGRHPLTPISYADDPRRSWRLPAQAWVIVTSAVLVFVLAIVAALWRGFESLFLRWPWLSDATLVSLLVVFLIVLAGLAHGIYGWAKAKALHARVVRTRLGNPADVQQVLEMNPLTLEALHVQLEMAQAPYRLHPNLSTGTTSRAAEKPVEALPAPANGINLIPDSEWLPWLVEAPHLLIAGATNAGKTTMARLALAQALKHGAMGFIIDPKGKQWYGLPVVGAGRDFEAMLQALDGVRAELAQRYRDYGAGKRSFTPLVIVVDEVPDLMQACKPLQGQRSGDPRWSLFARSLGSLAREVSIRVILISQSPAVDDLGINSGMRDNYRRIALAEKIPMLINEDVSPDRRLALRQLYQGQRFPAACIRHGEVHLLDTSNVPTLANADIQCIGWRPSTKPADEQPNSKKARLRWYRRHGYGRQQVRDAGLSFDNDEWAEAGKALVQTQTGQPETAQTGA